MRKKTQNGFSRPGVNEITAYAHAEGLDQTKAEPFWRWAESRDWKMSGEPIRCWKGAFRAWCKRNEATVVTVTTQDDPPRKPAATEDPATKREMMRARILKRFGRAALDEYDRQGQLELFIDATDD